MRVPSATYRLQLSGRFRFADARALIPYLHQLGITDVYLSPVLTARSVSSHGYDLVDPTRLNPELGQEEDFEELTRDLRRHDMGLLLDIVPNHMAASPENPWWMDVLESGPGSPYAAHFDIDWDAGAGRLTLPVLGRPYRETLEKGEIVLALDERGLYVRYYDLRFPTDVKSYGAVLSQRLGDLRETLASSHAGLQGLTRIIDKIGRLPERGEAGSDLVAARQRNKETIKSNLWTLCNAYPEIKRFLEENVRLFNSVKAEPHGSRLLDQLLAEQAYRLVFWRTGIQEINYRRFFDISDLVGIRVEDAKVFEAVHGLIIRLAREGKVTGLRVDHIDGLYEPLGYLRRLRRSVGPQAGQKQLHSSFYVLVEKILTGQEALPEEWPVCGTTGYDFLNALNGVFVDRKGVEQLKAAYATFTGRKTPFGDVVYQQKRRLAMELFPGELRSLADALELLARDDAGGRRLDRKKLEDALLEVAACFPVYRTYVRDYTVSKRDRQYIEDAVREASQRSSATRGAAFDLLRRVLLLDTPPSLAGRRRVAWLRFIMRWQQFTGPLMAKGLEDTALYLYNPLLSLNDVGGDPDGVTDVATFHRRNQNMAERWPHTLNTTSTHDTKRSEDVRARINVLSETPEEWGKRLSRWSRWNNIHKRLVHGEPVPDANEETLLYQTLIGGWPLEEDEAPAFGERVKAYVVKAAREAKTRTSWLDPDAEHERALVEFVDAVLSRRNDNRFLSDLRQFQEMIAYYGAINSLSQVLLKIASSGAPDLYQGCELWDLSLVDPDNRRPVDFPRRTRLVEELRRRESEDLAALLGDLLAHWQDGRVKMYLTAKALAFRRENAGLFADGEYLALSAAGAKREHVVTFARRKGRLWALVAVPRLIAKLTPPGELRPEAGVWGRSAIILPKEAPDGWLNVLTQERLDATRSPSGKGLPLRAVFGRFPVALLSGSER
jgi:(1->4)-alpha-D-glucan 1-alpha-D-glucosylmutase